MRDWPTAPALVELPAGWDSQWRPAVRAFDTQRYPFRQIMAAHLGGGDLESLHERFEVPSITPANDQETDLHRAMYRVGAKFRETYRLFVRDWVQPLFDEDVIFQTAPSLRYQPPGSVAVGRWHRDADFGHGTSEINVWVPLTVTDASTSVWLESSPGSEDYGPTLVPYGSAMLFRAVGLMHGNVASRPGRTRVSFEFRVMRASSYRAAARKSVKQGLAFRIGEYFDQL